MYEPNYRVIFLIKTSPIHRACRNVLCARFLYKNANAHRSKQLALIFDRVLLEVEKVCANCFNNAFNARARKMLEQ